MRKFTASLLIAVTLWSSFIVPAKAFIPLLFPAAVGSVTTAQGTIALSAMLSTVTIGSIITYVAMTNDNATPASNGSNVAIQVQLDPYTPLIAPESATAPPTMQPVTSEVVESNVEAHYESSACGSDALPQTNTISSMGNSVVERCKAFNSAFFQSCTNYGGVSGSEPSFGSFDIILANVNCSGGNVTAAVSKQPGCATGTTWNGAACIRTVTACPSGYTLNSGDGLCYVNDPDETQVADAKIQIQRILDQFQKNPNDPDPLPPNITITPTQVTIKSPDNVTTIKANPDSTVDIQKVSPGPNGTTVQDNLKLSPPGLGSAPQVIGKQQQVRDGQQLGPDGEPVIPSDLNGNPNPAVPGTSALNLPENLAKTEKQCGYDAEHPCTTDVKESVDKLVNEDPALQGQKDAAQNKLTQLETEGDDFENDSQTTLAGLTSDPLNQHGITWEWFPELPTAECSTFQYGAGTHVYTWDFCPVVTKIRDIFGYVLYIVTAIALFYIALGRKAE